MAAERAPPGSDSATAAAKAAKAVAEKTGAGAGAGAGACAGGGAQGKTDTGAQVYLGRREESSGPAAVPLSPAGGALTSRACVGQGRQVVPGAVVWRVLDKCILAVWNRSHIGELSQLQLSVYYRL
jgi:hypothetical protein